ncbi:MAG TPA: MFS transporter [Beijerinckiaceae bacterium]|jgi:MFS family permease|nr:MFS transporter [Beijerinckiaceae bacterium]
MSVADEIAASDAASAGSYGRKALAASAVGYAMDGFDFLILGFMMSAIARDLGLSATAGASLATFTLIGAVIGGFVFGMLADAYGRVRVLSLTILIFAVFTGLSAFAQGYWDLVAYRTIAGLGLGGEFGIGMALVAEAWPASQRARASSYVGLGWQAGVLAAALITPLLLPLIGWRGMFLVGLIPALASFFIRRSVGEPELFRRKQATGFPVRLLVKDAATTRISLGMFILCSVQNFGYYGLMIWMPNYLARQFGFSLTQSAVWTSVTILGMGFGIWLFGELADRLGRRPIFMAYQVGAFVMVLVYSQLTNPTALLIGGAIMGLFVNGMLGGYGALMSELYPTKVRATAQNVLFNLGRGVGGFGPVVIATLAGAYSFSAAIALLALIYLVDIAATYFLIPERKGMALE